MAEDGPGPTGSELMPGRAPAPALDQALARVPGYRPGLPLTVLPGGSVNRSYRLLTSAGAFVVRTSGGPDAWLTPDRSVEQLLHAAAAAADLAPRMVAADPLAGWQVTEWVDGQVWTADRFADAGPLCELAGVLQRLHGLPAPDAGRIDVLAVLAGYVERIAADAGTLALAAEAWQVSGAAERRPAIVHHDLHGSNVLATGRGLLLLDWECAAVADPLLDIACILSYHPAARAHAGLLLRGSGLGAVTDRQLAAALWLFDVHTWCWYRERAQRQRPTAAELEAEQDLSRRLPAALAAWRSGKA